MTPLSRPIAALLLAALLVIASLVGACSGGAARSAPASAAPTPVGSDSGGGSGGSGIAGGGGGSVEGNPGTFGAPVPVPPPGSGDTGVPSPSPTEVHPVGGLLSVHDVPATAVRAALSGNHLVAQVYWWSGPPPCSELAEVATARSGDTFTLTVREGAAQLGVACPALAMYKVTTVDLGPVSAGTYTVKALGVDVGAVVVYAG